MRKSRASVYHRSPWIKPYLNPHILDFSNNELPYHLSLFKLCFLSLQQICTCAHTHTCTDKISKSMYALIGWWYEFEKPLKEVISGPGREEWERRWQLRMGVGWGLWVHRRMLVETHLTKTLTSPTFSLTWMSEILLFFISIILFYGVLFKCK